MRIDRRNYHGRSSGESRLRSTRVVLVHGYPDEAFPFSEVSRFVFLGRMLSIVVWPWWCCSTRTGSRADERRSRGITSCCRHRSPRSLSSSTSRRRSTTILWRRLVRRRCFSMRSTFESPSLSTSALKCGIALGLGLLTKSSLVPLAVMPALTLIPSTCGSRRYEASVSLAVLYAVAGAAWGIGGTSAMRCSTARVTDHSSAPDDLDREQPSQRGAYSISRTFGDRAPTVRVVLVSSRPDEFAGPRGCIGSGGPFL